MKREYSEVCKHLYFSSDYFSHAILLSKLTSIIIQQLNSERPILTLCQLKKIYKAPILPSAHNSNFFLLHLLPPLFPY